MKCKAVFLFFFCLTSLQNMYSQQDTLVVSEPSFITHQEKRWVRSSSDSTVTDSLFTEVIFVQDSVIMYCDSAIIVNDIDITAWGNVAIVQNDTIEIFSDTLKYNAETKKSILIGNVLLSNQSESLYTDLLLYDLNTKVANYNTRATMTQNDVTLQSEIGEYDVGRQKAYFSKGVEVVDSSFILWTDTLNYNLKTERARFFGPTRIDQNEAQLYCEGGTYDIADKAARLEKHAQYKSDSLIASADVLFYDGNTNEVVLQENAKFKKGSSYGESIQIVYNEKTQISVLTGEAYFVSENKRIRADVIEHNGVDDSFSTRGRMSLVEDNQKLTARRFYSKPGSDVKIATGEVLWIDTIQNISLEGDSLFIKESDNSVDAIGESQRPLLHKVNGQDTIWLSAMLISAFDVEDSLGTKSVFEAMEDVRVLSDDFQATSHYLEYQSRDSTLSLTNTPILWVDSTQFLADTIIVDMVNNEPSVLHLIGNGLIISESYPTVFDQIKGREVTAWLTEGDLDSMLVEGNAESIYFMKDDDDLFIGADKTECSSIKFFFSEGELKKIQSVIKPTSTFLPMQGINLQELVLSGFGWYIEKRPLVLNDLKVEIQ